MPRHARVASPGRMYHVLNRTVGRMQMLRREKDFAAFDHLLQEAHQRCPLPILSYCIPGNPWHFVV